MTGNKIEANAPVLLDDIYQNAHFNETNKKDGGQFSPHILLRETRAQAYPHEKGECDKQGEIPPPYPIPFLYTYITLQHATRNKHS